jgi:hypothetical protein
VLFTKFKQPFALVNVPFFLDHAIVLRPELLAKGLTPTLPGKQIDEGSDDHGCDYDQQYHNLS